MNPKPSHIDGELLLYEHSRRKFLRTSITQHHPGDQHSVNLTFGVPGVSERTRTVLFHSKDRALDAFSAILNTKWVQGYQQIGQKEFDRHAKIAKLLWPDRLWSANWVMSDGEEFKIVTNKTIQNPKTSNIGVLVAIKVGIQSIERYALFKDSAYRLAKFRDRPGGWDGPHPYTIGDDTYPITDEKELGKVPNLKKAAITYLLT